MQNQPLPTAPMLTSQDSRTLSALEKWEPATEAPATKAQLSTVISNLSNLMEPASPFEYAQAMAKLIEFAAAFGIPCQDHKVAHTIYREQLGKLPGDLLFLAIDRIKGQWVWGNRMPFPADILKMVKEDHAKRVTLLSRAKLAHLKATEPTAPKPKITPEQFQRAQARIKQTTSKKSRLSSKEPEGMSEEEAVQQLERDRLEFLKKIQIVMAG